MGHYDDCYEEEDERLLNQTRKEIIRKLDGIESKEDMYLIERLIDNRKRLENFFSLLKNGIV